MRKITFFKTILLTIALVIGSLITAKADSVIPRLYLTTRNTPSGYANWTITSATIDNTTIDYWKMLSGSSLESPTMNFSLFTNIQIALSLQSFGTITSHSDDIKIEYWDGTIWTQVGSNLHTSNTSNTPETQTVSLPYSFTSTKIKITAPNATTGVGARVLSIDITGTAASPAFINTVSLNSKIYSSNGKITLSASNNQTIEIYNSVGQKLFSTKAIEGLNTIPILASGVVLVKVDNKITKVVL